ncbi:hypothetical protein [Cupriavidus metallidurans]|uniref:hypothetical protein n=1 Tax=Cupriavidus metallidurans TaxID=119219 RepID=UPI001647F0AE|nr:hypothetical protein [Cupriavidus metallidurans]
MNESPMDVQPFTRAWAELVNGEVKRLDAVHAGQFQNTKDIDEAYIRATAHRAELMKLMSLRFEAIASAIGLVLDSTDREFALAFGRAFAEKITEGDGVTAAQAIEAGTIAGSIARTNAKREAASSKPRLSRAGTVGAMAEVGQ